MLDRAVGVLTFEAWTALTSGSESWSCITTALQDREYVQSRAEEVFGSGEYLSVRVRQREFPVPEVGVVCQKVLGYKHAPGVL